MLDSKSCIDALVDSTKCADPAWTFWQVGNDKFCCEDGLEGRMDRDGFLGCVAPEGLHVQAKRQVDAPLQGRGFAC